MLFAMKYLTFTFIFMMMVTLTHNTASAQSSCHHAIQLGKVISPSSGTSVDGKVELKITGSGTYKVTLVKVTPEAETEIGTKQGSGSQYITFTGLSNQFVYRVKAEFPGEEKFLCRNRFITDIFSTEGK